MTMSVTAAMAVTVMALEPLPHLSLDSLIVRMNKPSIVQRRVLA